MGGLAEEAFDLVVPSNTLEHLQDPWSFLAGVLRCLTAAGQILVAVPPLYTEADAEMHARNRFHRSNLTVSNWHALFEQDGWCVRCYRHEYPGDLDFSSPFPSRARDDDFLFESTNLAGLLERRTISAIFLLHGSRLGLNVRACGCARFWHVVVKLGTTT